MLLYEIMWKVYNIHSWAAWGKTGLISSDWDLKKLDWESNISRPELKQSSAHFSVSHSRCDRSTRSNYEQQQKQRHAADEQLRQKNQRDLLTRKLIFSTFVLDIFSHHEVELLLLLLWSVSWKFARGSSLRFGNTCKLVRFGTNTH